MSASPRPQLSHFKGEAGKLKDVMDKMKEKSAEDFGRLLGAAKKEPLEGTKFSEAWFRGITNRIKADPASRKMSEIVYALSPYHEFEETKLSVALQNKDYNPQKHRNDLLDAEQLVYLSDPSVCFLTCDRDFKNLVKKSPQAKQIIIVNPDELEKAANAEALLYRVTNGQSKK